MCTDTHPVSTRPPLLSFRSLETMLGLPSLRNIISAKHNQVQVWLDPHSMCGPHHVRTNMHGERVCKG